MYYRSFSLPKDLYIFPIAMVRIIFFRLKINRKGYNNMLRDIRGCNGPGKADRAFLIKYIKYYKALSFLLIRVIGDKNPCMIRSLVLYGLCRKDNIGAVLKTGVRRDNAALTGHSWVEIGGRAVGEDKEFIENFTVVHEV